MPNWCQNELRVSGSAGDCAEFRALARGIPPRYADDPTPPVGPRLPLSLNALVPVPAEVLAAGYYAAGYAWQCTHWGTKWELDHDLLVEELPGAGLVYAFETAWSPPEPWLVQVADAFPWLRLELTYFEPGMLFCGRLRAEHGRVIELWKCLDYSDALVAFVREQFGWDPEEYMDDDDGESAPCDDAA
jgi:hypothetical protein